MVKIDASTAQDKPVLAAVVVVVVVVVVTTPLPPFNTQLGNCDHEPVPKHVTLRLPPVLTYPLAHVKTM